MKGKREERGWKEGGKKGKGKREERKGKERKGKERKGKERKDEKLSFPLTPDSMSFSLCFRFQKSYKLIKGFEMLFFAKVPERDRGVLDVVAVYCYRLDRTEVPEP